MNTQHLTLAELESFDSRSPRQNAKERRFACPLCGRNKPLDSPHRSLAVNTENGMFFCHRCQTKGKLKEFWETRPIMPKKQKIKSKLISHFSISETNIKKNEPEKSENLAEKMKKYQDNFLHSPAEIYLLNRGISTDTAIKGRCGYAENWEHWEKKEEKWLLLGTDRRVVFPIYNSEGELVALHGRAIDTNHLASSKITRGDKSNGLFLSDAECLKNKVLAICEGAIDAMALASVGISAVAMTGINPPDWFYRKMAFRRVLIATDADLAGDKAAFQIKNRLTSLGTKTFRLRPKLVKDWGEVLESIGVEGMQKYLVTFQENLSDEIRLSYAKQLLQFGKFEAAEFATELITNPQYRHEFLFQILEEKSKKSEIAV